MSLTGVSAAADTAIAFANTACPDAACHTDSNDLAGLLRALSACGALDAETERRLVRAYAGTPQGERAAKAILSFRTVAVDVLETLRSGKPLPNALLEAVNKELLRCGCLRKLSREGNTYRAETLFEINVPEDTLMPVAHSLAEIITSAPPERLKQCREPRCICYFIDTSKNATRTWCSMQRCGNRQKVANYYRRERARTN
jgi:predicted RNA-binding Zn ribbon-like protein